MNSKINKPQQILKVYSNPTQYRLLQSKLVKEQTEQNKKIFQAVNFISLTQFFKKLLDIFVEQTGDSQYFLLNSVQLKNLSELVISKELNIRNSMILSTSVNLAQPYVSATDLLMARKIKYHYFLVKDELNHAPVNQQLFNRLNNLLNKELKKNDYLDEVLLLNLLLKQFKLSWLKDYEIEMYLNEPTHLEAQLSKKLNLKTHCHFAISPFVQKKDKQNELRVYLARQKQQELNFAFRKIKDYQKKYPEKRIVLASAQIKKYQSLLEQLVDWNPTKISLVERKNQVINNRVFGDALSLFKLFIQKSVDLNQLIISFQSLSFYHQIFNYSAFLAQLSQIKRRNINIQTFIEIIFSFDSSFARTLGAIEQKFRAKQKKSFLNWSKEIVALLFALKWQVSERISISDEEKINENATKEANSFSCDNWQKLHQTLDELTTLDLIYPNQTTANYFLDSFESIISKVSSNNLFYLNSILVAPINELGNLSNPNLTLNSDIKCDTGFDAIWLLGLDENYPSVNPVQSLLNYEEQRQKIETCNPKIIFEKSQAQFNFYRNNIDIIGLSYAQFDDKVNYQISNIANQPDIKIQLIEDLTSEDKQLNQAKKKNQFIQDKLKNNLAIFKKASVSQLDRFNQCNFLSFAEKFLVNSDSDKDIEDKPTAREKGILLHQTLDDFFKKIPNSQILKKLSKQQIKNITNQSINLALKNLMSFSKVYQNTEKKYLVDLMLAFTEDIKNREFEVIESELTVDLKLNNFSLTGRIDRIEKSKQIGVDLIDVKTSNKPWTNESLQLLIYAWMITKTKDMKINQSYYQSFYFDKAKVTIRNNITEFEKSEAYFDTIESYLKYFQSGELLIRFDKKVCDNCSYRSLCRIDERKYYS